MLETKTRSTTGTTSKIWFLLLFIVSVFLFAIFIKGSSGSNNTNTNPKKNPTDIFNYTETNNEYDLFNMTLEQYDAVITNVDFEHLGIPKDILQTIHMMNPNERAFEMEDKDFLNAKMYAKGIPLPVKDFEPEVWSCVFMKISLQCKFLSDPIGQTTFNQDFFEQLRKQLEIQNHKTRS